MEPLPCERACSGPARRPDQAPDLAAAFAPDRPCTISSDFSTFSAGFMPPTVAATLPSGVTMNVVRSAKPWSIASPRVFLNPDPAAGASVTFRS